MVCGNLYQSIEGEVERSFIELRLWRFAVFHIRLISYGAIFLKAGIGWNLDVAI